jgi:S-adenosylmethionine-diacylglycerol 3-amino-3-carboxypropyl transferase
MTQSGLVPRIHLDDAREDRLYFAQVREDPCLEIETLRPGAETTLAVVSSGGCTALSLLAAGAEHVIAIDRNPTQNHLLELKAAAVMLLEAAEARALLGAVPAERGRRAALYAALREELSPATRAFWDARPAAIDRGVLRAGVTERFIDALSWLVRHAVHGKALVDELLGCSTLEEQRAVYRRWNTPRWRALFRLLLNRRAMSRVYDPAFFRHAGSRDFADHFLGLLEHGLTEIPAASNYFLRQMLTGSYSETASPPYLTDAGAARLRERRPLLTVVDGSFTAFLRGCGRASLDGFALSNIGEWLSAPEREDLFGEIARTAAPGAMVCFRNFVGFTQVPAAWRHALVEDRAAGEALIRRDRSLVQYRFVPCRIVTAGRGSVEHPRPARARDAEPRDNPALVALAEACPMDGEIGLCVSRAPDFFALTRLEGERARVGVVDAEPGSIAGCVAVAERRAYVHGSSRPTLYVSDLKVHPSHRGGRVADALVRYVREATRAAQGDDALVLLTILAGNRPMERRAAGRSGEPALTRFATLRVHSMPLLRWSPPAPRDGLTIAPAAAAHVEEMATLWSDVAPARQFAPALDAAALARCIETSPGLGYDSYLLARRPDGRLAGFMAVWDQSSLKQLRVTTYSRRLAAFRLAFNAIAPTPLPRTGEPLRSLSAFHLCVPAESPGVLRSLVLHAIAHRCRQGYSFLSIGLDVRDPLRVALRGLLAQPTDVHAYVSRPYAALDEPALSERPLHFETALV